MLTIGLTAAGVFLGMILIPLLLRWAALVHATFKREGGAYLGEPKRRLPWAAPLVLFLHPALYFVAALVVLPILAARGRIWGGWTNVLVGFCAYALLIAAVATVGIIKARKRMRTARNV